MAVRLGHPITVTCGATAALDPVGQGHCPPPTPSPGDPVTCSTLTPVGHSHLCHPWHCVPSAVPSNPQLLRGTPKLAGGLEGRVRGWRGIEVLGRGWDAVPHQ